MKCWCYPLNQCFTRPPVYFELSWGLNQEVAHTNVKCQHACCEQLLQCCCTLLLHRTLAVCSHSRGISSSFQLNGWKGASVLTVASRTLNPWFSAHFQLKGRKLILMRIGPPGLHQAYFDMTLASSFHYFLLCAWAVVCARMLRSASQAVWRKKLKDTAICFSREIDETVVTLRFLAAVRTRRVDEPGQAQVLSHTEQGDC